MLPLKSAYVSILITVILLALTLVAGNTLGGVQAAPARSPQVLLDAAAPGTADLPAPAVQAAAPGATAEQAATPQQAQNPVGEVRGTAQPGDKVKVSQGAVLIGETVAGPDGTWKVPIAKAGSAITPYHVQIVPAAIRGAEPLPEGGSTVFISIIVGLSKVEVRVQVTTPNGQVDVEVLTPINPPCENQSGQSAPQQPAQPVYHQVRAGETLAGIASRYGVTTQAVMQANKLRNANLIYVGQRLLIPAAQK